MTQATLIPVTVGITGIAAGAFVGVGVYFVRFQRALGRIARVERFTEFCGWLVLLIASGGIATHAWGQVFA